MSMKEIGYESCRLCPHQCGIDRTAGEQGVCTEGSMMRIAWMGLHLGEEPPLIGSHGSGTIFFAGCPLHCAFCQNCQISARHAPTGVPVTVSEFSQLLCELQDFGAANINLVTGTHFIPSIIEGVAGARELGCTLPVVWNSSGFESVQALELIDPCIDTYLVDLKTFDRAVASRFCGSARYVDEIESVMQFLFHRHPRTVLSDDKVTGTIVRHLVFPGTFEATEEVLRWFALYGKESALLSLMVQFVPPAGGEDLPAIDAHSYDRLIDLLDTLEIEEGFIQELGDNLPWIPDFTRNNPFPEHFARPLPGFIELRDRST